MTFSGPKEIVKVNLTFLQRDKVPLVYLDGKLQEDRYSGCNFQGKKPEIGKKNIFTEKQTTKKVPLMFLDVKFLTER